MLPYTQADEDLASAAAGELSVGFDPAGGGVRHVAAAARLAYDRSRDRYVSNRAAEVARNAILGLPLNAVRADDDGQHVEPSRPERDRAASRALLELISHAAAQDE